MSRNLSDLLFRVLFSSIFLGLGMEHIFSDSLIMLLMPAWLPDPRTVSIISGCILISGGTMILLGWNVRIAAMVLGSFVITVTLTVHLPGLFTQPTAIPSECSWLWTVFQRSNFVKNLCLLGVCFHLLHHQVGRYSIYLLFPSKKTK